MTGLTCEEIRALGPAGMLLRTTSRTDSIHLHGGDASVRAELKARYDTLIANYPGATVEDARFRARAGASCGSSRSGGPFALTADG